ncbi:MAG: alpha-amylase [Bacteroidales bacterium]|nr:alpha-amylase [Bacteroidales bacterium]
MKKQAVLLLVPVFAALSMLFSCDPKVDPVVNNDLSVSPESVSFEAEDKGHKLILVTTAGDWTATPSDSWIHLAKTSGTGNASLDVSVDANAKEDRSGSITVKGSNTVTVAVSQKGKNVKTLTPIADAFDGTKRSSTTYQLLIYSFADSDGDGVGDFKGIQNKLDYLDGLGATALWLSPAHPSDSYHAYDVTDYYDVNPLYGTVQDFKNLIDAAHARGIKIYMDYVLNHSGKGNSWFTQALADPSSPYRDYYFFSTNPSKDYSSFPMLKGTSYKSDEWKQATSGSPKLTIKKTTEAVTNGTSNWNLYMWQDNVGDKAVNFVDKGDGTYYLVMDINGKWGMLVRKYMNWDAGSKFGASGTTTLTDGATIDLVAEGKDISFTGNGRYKIELTNVSTETLYYMGCFSDWMPDLNYGDPSKAETNPCFQDLAASADKWINLGVDGFRLDAVKHICGGIGSFNHSSNQTLLKKWYEHCNATYKAAGHDDNIFMVAEEWDGHVTEKQYYKSLTSCFEFEYFGALTQALNGNASNYVSSVSGYVRDHSAVRDDAITSLFMTNHDQNRAAESLGKNVVKEKQAAAMLLTSPGKPFIYQGEELGYYGKKDNGDEYVRTPMMWDKAGKDCAKKGVNNKVDNGMLKSDISVEAQDANSESLLNVYKTFSRVRNTYPALAEGTMTNAGLKGGNSIAAWYMTAGSQKMLVIHNTASGEKSVAVSDDISKPVAILGTVTLDQDTLTLSGNSSVVFLL